MASPAQQKRPDSRGSVLDDSALVLAAELSVADALGQLMEFWGFKRHMGRTWTILFLSPDPMDAAALADALSISTSAVSLSLSELLRWGAVKKEWLPGDRRDHYVAETRVWRLVRGVVERRELAMIRDAQDVFDEAERIFRQTAARGTAKKTLRFKRRRLAYLRALAKLGDRLVRALVAGKTVDPSELLSAHERVEEPV